MPAPKGELVRVQTTFRSIPLGSIQANGEFNIRSETSSVEDLVGSIRAIGLQQPLGVREIPGQPGEYDLVYGFRRFRAILTIAKEDNLSADTDIPCQVVAGDVERALCLLLNMQENIVRQTLNPMEEARGFARLLAEGVSEERVLSVMGATHTLLVNRLSLLKMSATIQQAVADYDISVMQARAIGDLPEEFHAQYVEMAKELSVNKLKELVSDKLKELYGPVEDPPEERARTKKEKTEGAEDDFAPAPLPMDADPAVAVDQESSVQEDNSQATGQDVACGLAGDLFFLVDYAFSDDTGQAADLTSRLQTVDFLALPTEDLETLAIVIHRIAECCGLPAAEAEVATEAVEEPEGDGVAVCDEAPGDSTEESSGVVPSGDLSVFLTDVPSGKRGRRLVVAALCEMLNCKEKDISLESQEEFPLLLAENVSTEQAMQMRETLEGLGCTVDVSDSD